MKAYDVTRRTKTLLRFPNPPFPRDAEPLIPINQEGKSFPTKYKINSSQACERSATAGLDEKVPSKQYNVSGCIGCDAI